MTCAPFFVDTASAYVARSIVAAGAAGRDERMLRHPTPVLATLAASVA